MSFNLAEDKGEGVSHAPNQTKRHELITPKDNDEQKEIVGWASTERGGKFAILEGEDKKQALQRHLESVQGKKGNVIREHEQADTKKSIQKRFGIAKTPFKIRDEVTFDDFTKKGIVYGYSGDSLLILSLDGRRFSKEKTLVFKTSELVGGIHWDAMTTIDRVITLKKAGLSENYLNSSWYYIPFAARNKIQKAMGPAGYEGGGVNTSTSGVFNPVHQEKTVSERIKEEESKPRKSPTVAEEVENRKEEDKENMRESQRNFGSGKEPRGETLRPRSSEERERPPQREEQDKPRENQGY